METHVEEALYEEMVSGFVESEPERVMGAVEKALAGGVPALAVQERGLKRGLDRLGELFEREVVFLPQMMFGAKIFSDALEMLKPHLAASAPPPGALGTVVIGTVHGDLHDLGKNLVSLMWGISGFQVIDLGMNVPTEAFLAAVREHSPRIVGLSSLLTTTMLEQRKVIESLAEAGLRDNVRVLVGGAPVSERWAREIGADGYAGDAARAVAVARSLL